jgi:hypothetical protein
MVTPADNEGDIAGEFGVLVQSIQKGKSQVRISISEFKGHEYIDIRTFYLPKNGGGEEYLPTKRGVTIPTDSYWHLLKGIVELGSTLGLLDPDTVVTLDEKSSQN